MSFRWSRCDQHPYLVLSVIETLGAPGWCVGDGETISGHWVELEKAA